jgi:hypothetical protein
MKLLGRIGRPQRTILELSIGFLLEPKNRQIPDFGQKSTANRPPLQLL